MSRLALKRKNPDSKTQAQTAKLCLSPRIVDHRLGWHGLTLDRPYWSGGSRVECISASELWILPSSGTCAQCQDGILARLGCNTEGITGFLVPGLPGARLAEPSHCFSPRPVLLCLAPQLAGEFRDKGWAVTSFHLFTP